MISIAAIIQSVLDIVSKTMAWTTPEQKIKRMRIKIEKIKKARRELLRKKSTPSRSKKMVKLNKELLKCTAYLTSAV